MDHVAMNKRPYIIIGVEPFKYNLKKHVLNGTTTTICSKKPVYLENNTTCCVKAWFYFFYKVVCKPELMYNID